VTLVLAILLALFVLPTDWGIAAVAAATVWEVAQTVGGMWWSTRRRAQVGAEALAGESARVVRRCDPLGTVSVRGELWRARCEGGAETGELVRIRGLDGLTLLVERDDGAAPRPRGPRA